MTHLNDNKYPVNTWPYFDEETIAEVSRVLQSGKVNYWTGDETRMFEKEFAEFVGVKHAVALANGTVALELALKALGVGPGDEVIVTPRSFIASVGCVITVGAKPVFADVDLNSGNISAETIQKVITKKTKVIIPVHLAGWPCDMDPIMELAGQHNLYVIEDCAQAHGAKYKGRSVGSIGHIGAWSFCQDKIMTLGGEGGMITTNDSNIWNFSWSYKDHGKAYKAVYNGDEGNRFKWVHHSIGTNWRMLEVQAVIGRLQLKKLPLWHEKRNKNAREILEVAKKCHLLRISEMSESIEHGWYKCYVYIKPDMLCSYWSREKIIDEINKRGTPCFSGSCSEIYLEKAFDNRDIRPKVCLTNAKILGETSLMFLVHPTLTSQDIEASASVLTEVMLMASRETNL